MTGDATSEDFVPRDINPRDITERDISSGDLSSREISQRIRDAVAPIRIAPNARVLEIGCGDGMAAALVCEQLGEGGSMLAIDRSPVMIAATGERNDVHVLSKLLEVRAARAQRASLEPGSFDLVFGINVRNMWDDPATAKTLLASLAPEGRLWAVLQLPPGKDATGLDATIAGRLEKVGFTVLSKGVFGEGQTPGCWVECSA
ncbi:MAG: methyltransferase protein [Thermoleophilia bacterium]|nr:methyltransferase protein [Thermoleophilia bacterium]